MKTRMIFRKEALDQLAGGNQADRLLTVLTIRAWIPMAAIGCFIAVMVVWSFWGRIHQTVEGAGVLINPGRLRPISGAFGGKVLEVLIRPGQVIGKGDVVARIGQPELDQKLQQSKIRLRELEGIDKVQGELDTRRAEQERQARIAQEKLIDESVRQLEVLAGKAEESIGKLARDQKEQVRKSQIDLSGLNATLLAKRKALKDLADRKVATTDQIVQTESSVIESNLRLSELSLRLSELEIKDIENKDFLFRQKSRIAELEIQRRQLLVQATQSQQTTMAAQDLRRAQLAEARDQVLLMEWQLKEQGELKSSFFGRVLSVEIHEGQLYQPGARAGSVELHGGAEGASMTAMAYFPLRQGKKIIAGMKARISPTVVERERYGSIVARVKSVSDFPVTEEGAANILGNPELVKALAQPGGVIEAELELEAADTASGYRWTSAGPPSQVSPGTAAVVHVTTEERAPVSFVIPLLRSITEGSGVAP